MQKHHLLHVLFLSGLLTACGGSGSDSEPPSLPDFDNDGIADNVDTDDDNDGIADTSDAFPFDASEWLDTDLDGVGDNADEDDDNDGTPDIDDAFPLDSTEQTDTDADGIGNNADEDDDNDGTPDIDDAFPLDPTEQIDTDGDGIGNNADEDDDNDGVPDSEDAFPLDPNESADADGDGIGDNADFYPNDVVCHVELDGNGEQCYLTYFKENKLNIQTYTFDGTITFFDSAEKQIIQLNSETLSFNAPITIDVADDLSSLAYSSSDQMFYAGSLQGVVYAIDSTGAGVILYESDFAVRKVSLFGEFVAFIDDGYDLTTVDKNGSFNSRHSGYSTTLETEWDSATQSAFIYEVDKDKNPFLARVSIIQQNGIVDYIVSRFVDAERTTNRSLILSKDESESVIYAGKVFSQSELDELADESISPVFNDWLDGVGLITLDYAASDTSLTWYSEDFDVYANTVLRGRALGLALTESRAIVITERLSQFQISTFEFSDDVDGDQVSNEVDAFPNDIAASVDSDGDGYPDMWNDGKSDGDSTTGLSLDAFPSQYDCFLETHANAQGTCDHSATIPNSTPTSVMTGPQDTAFIYMAEQGRIYVYDGANDEFSASLDFADHQRGLGLEQAPQQIIYNASHERFYFHYSDDMLFARDYSDGVLSEAAEVSTFEEETINNLVNVGDYILVRMLGYRGVRYLFDSNGVQTDTDSTNYFSRAALYDENRQRIYHFRDGISPNDLMYTEIDVSSGSFGASVDSPYHGDYAFYGSINLVNNEQDIVIGSGDIFDAEDLTWKGSYGPLEAIAGLANDEVVVFTDNGDATRLTRKDSTNRTLETRVLASSHVDVVKTENATLLVYSTDDALVVEPYVANNDSDEDGVTNLDDAFPLDPAASLDSDNDGYPDEWNAGFTESDSTTGLSLDAFPNDSACWLSSHADADGFCDYSATMPTFTPDETFVDSNGIVHLVSFENASVYRWSPESSSFINPIKIGRNDGFVQSTPVLAAISNSHGRLYFGYESGQITFIDLDDVSSEQAFYRLPQRVGGLHAVGDFVLAQDASGSWETHYIIDENGVLTDSEDWNRFSSHYAWNDVKQRVYFFRDTTSPNDIHFETVDQTSGQITESGESPYHGEYQIQGPIVISALGEQVILGSGDIYDADDLTWLGNIGQFSQAIAYTNGEIGVLRSQGDGYIYARLDESGRVLEEYTVSASFAVLASNGTDSTLVTLDDSGEYSIVPVVANNDTDGDGVSNIEDAFPLDPAASVDSDGDGYPDYWNTGYDQDDSTTGLLLDAFPSDSACWDLDHANATGTCDYAATMPSFTPSHMAMDELGVIYLMNPADGRVYRWNQAENSYLNPLRVGSDNVVGGAMPIRMTYSESHRRLYFGYDDGRVTYVSIEGSTSEEHFYRLPLSVGGLVATGDYILAQDESGSWNTHYILDMNGVLTDSKDWNYYSSAYAWNPTNSRVYFFSDSQLPTDLHYETIDQNSGLIAESGESPYHSSEHISGPITLINNGSQVLLGSGAIYDATDLTLLFNAAINIVDAASFDEVFVAISEDNDGNQTLNVYSHEGFALEHFEPLEQSIMAAYRWDNQLVMVGRDNGEFTFTLFEMGDGDSDGMPAWWELAYGLSDEDAMDAFDDNDADGLTNIEEYTNRSDPTDEDTDSDGLTDGAEVNTHLTNVVRADTDNDGLRDGEEVNTYGTSPIESDTDNDTFRDGDEVLLYQTDPLDPDSVPEAITSFSESFEGSELSSLFGTTDASEAPWEVSTFEPQDGEQVARSGNIVDNQTSSLTLTGLFADGTLSFDAKVSSESCCDMLRVYVNDEQVLLVRNGDWSTYSIAISQGETVVEWRYDKDGSVSNGEDSAFIDNLEFSQ